MTARPTAESGRLDTCATITELLTARAEIDATQVFLRTDTGDLTYRQVHDKSSKLAAALADIGIGAGDAVALLMRNCAEQVLLWFALARLGAVHVPINTALKGDLLAHALRVTGTHIAVADEDLLDQLYSATGDDDLLQTVVVRTASGSAGTSVHQSTADLNELITRGELRPAHPIDPLDDATMLFTSGTTGPSKACVLSHRYLLRQGQLHASSFDLRRDDVLYSPFPLFHIDAATLTVVAALAVGATAAIGSRFSVSGFWEEVRSFDVSVFNFMGATLTLLWKQDPIPQDRDHRVRLAWGVPMPDWKAGFEQRFGFPLYQVYGLTDAGVPVYDPIDHPQRPGACGRVIDEFEVRISDGDDNPGVSRPGRVGEILVRGREPGLTMTRYHGMPEATAGTIDRAGWVHTGDLGSFDEDGYLTFHGRLSDSIRRRGENISAYEVEQLVESHPAVVEAAAIGVPSEFTEEEIKVCVVRRVGAEITPEALYRYCREQTAPFMVPRYIEFVDQLPKTPTQKVEKFILRQLGITKATWDGGESRRHARDDSRDDNDAITDPRLHG